jgi:hypothetical protein
VDPIIVRGLAEALAPTVAILGVSVIPISIVFMTKYFKLRTRELELDAESHGRELEARLRALESRQGATESVISTLASGLSNSRELNRGLMEAPPDGATASRPPVARIGEK